MPVTTTRQFFRDGDGRIREILDVSRRLAQQSGRYIVIAPVPANALLLSTRR